MFDQSPDEIGAALRAAVDAVAAVRPDEPSDAGLGVLLRAVSRERDRLTAVAATLLAEHDRRVAWAGDGAPSAKEWLREHCRASAAEAAALAQTARRVAALPETVAAATAGDIAPSALRVAAAAVRDLPAQAAAQVDRFVAEQAAAVDPGRLRQAVDDYAHRLDAASLEAREQRAWRARRLSVGRTADGGVTVEGRLDPVGGETVMTALASLAAPTDAGDERTPDQRRADALVSLARRRLDADDLPVIGGARPHVTIVVPVETLRGDEGAPGARLDRVGVVSATTARRLACDATITRVVTRGTSMPLDVGRSTRVVSVAQRRALAVRDGGCVGCGAPAGWCEAHHVRHWADGGPTDLANLVQLCWRCHRTVHEGAARITTRGDGTFGFQRVSFGGGGGRGRPARGPGHGAPAEGPAGRHPPGPARPLGPAMTPESRPRPVAVTARAP